MDASVKERLLSKDMWLRVGLMVLFGIVSFILIKYVLLAIFIIAIAEIGSFLFLGNINQNVLQIGKIINNYIYQVLQFLIFASEEKPYPFSIWLSGKKAE